MSKRIEKLRKNIEKIGNQSAKAIFIDQIEKLETELSELEQAKQEYANV